MLISDFTTGLDGWTTTNSTESFEATGGNPSGNLRGVEGGGGVWYFSAPDAYLGDQSSFYGGSITFDLKQDIGENQFDDTDLILSGGGYSLVLDVGDNPGTDWTSYSVNLALGGGWRIGSLTGSIASEDQIRETLADLESLWVRGEFVTGIAGDASNLDNFVLAAEPVTPPDFIGARIASRFDSGIDGWSFVADVKEFDWIPSGGNPGGFLQAVDYAHGDTWYFVAPEKFLGDKSAYIGGTLSFDLKQDPITSQFDQSDVLITGGGRTIAFDTEENPGLDWTSYSVTLDTSTDWRLGDIWGEAASQAEIDAVLADIDSLWIRGEFVTGADTGGLDNVLMTPAASPVRVLSDTTTGRLLSNHDDLGAALIAAQPGNLLQIRNADAVTLPRYDITENGLTIQTNKDVETRLKLVGVQTLSLSGDNDIDVTGNGRKNLLTGSDGDNVLKGLGGRDEIRGGDGNDVIRGGNRADLLHGDNGNDRLFGNNGTDVLNGGKGRDMLNGGNHDDILNGNMHNDRLFGMAGNDVLKGGRGNDMLDGGFHRDLLIGNAGDDFLYGGGGADRLRGGQGDDLLDGGRGNDRLFGGAGSDLFKFADGFGKDRIGDFDATDDAEQIDLAGVTAITDMDDLVANHMSQDGTDVIIDAGGGDILTLRGVLMADLDAADFIF